MQKKGISGHIDWILGIAMFLLAIGSMIVLFKPGVTPATNADTMINLVQDKFISDTEWTIIKQPIFIAPIKYTQESQSGNAIAGPETGIKNVEFTNIPIITDSTSSDTSNSLPNKIGEFNLVKNKMEMFYIPTAESGELPESMDASETENDNARKEIKSMGHTALEREFGIKFDYSSNIIKIKTYLSNSPSTKDNINIKTKHLLLFNKNGEQINFDNDDTTIYSTDIKACYAKGNINEYTPDRHTVSQSGDECKVLYQLGIAEETKGISIQKFIDLDTTTGIRCITAGYECIKQNWNFPAMNNFKIKISLPNNPTSVITFPKDRIQPENAKIYARTITGQILTDDAESIPVSITIQVW